MKFGVATFVVTASLALVVVSGQRFSSSQLEQAAEYDYEDNNAAPPRHAPVQRSYSPGPARVNSAAAAAPKPTPVPILKQINRHNDDGSYTYGYEGADGSFKIETKLVTGEVMGKYGYVDDSGKVRVVEYGANRYGFQPAGEGITVAPPTLVDETRTEKPAGGSGLGGRYRLPSAAPAPAPAPAARPVEQDYDDGQYYEEPAAPTRAPAPLPAPRPQLSGRLTRPALSALASPSQLSSSGGPSALFSQSTNFANPSGGFGSGSSSFGSGSSNFGSSNSGFGSSFGSGSSSFGSGSPSYASPRAAALRSVGPAPPRAQVAGAVPVSAPAPVREPQNYAPQAPSPPQNLFVPQSQPQQVRRPSAASSGGLLDQLARDYALPQSSSQTVVDTSFGLY